MSDIAALGLRVDSGGVIAGTRHLEKFEGQARRTEGAAERMGKSLVRAAGAFAAMAAATMGFRAVISTLSGFETSMAAVAAITRATDAELAQLRDTAKQLGATTEFSASQAADALKFLGMAGFQTADAISAIPAVLDLATAAQMDLARAADISSNIMSAFGIAATDAAKVADVLAAASSRANTDVNQLGDGMKYVGPVAAAMGISMNDTAAAIGVLSDAGIQGAMAGTGLRRVLSSLANATPQATAVLNDMGLSLKDLNPATNSIVDIVDRLAASGIDAAQALTIFGDRGGPAILALVENNAKLAELTDGLKGVDGEAKRMADTMRDQLGGDIKGLQSALEGLIIQLGESGLTAMLRGLIQTMTAMARGVTGVMQSFSSFAASIDSVIGVSSTLGGAISLLVDNMDVLMAAGMATAAFFAGKLALSLGATMVQAATAGAGSLLMYSVSLGATSTASAIAAVSMQTLRVAISVMLGPVGIAIALIGALTAAIVMNGRETARQREIQERYTAMLDSANKAAETARKRLEDFRKKTGEVSDKVDEASGKVRSFTDALNGLSSSSMFSWLAEMNKEYGLYAQTLERVEGFQSKMGMDGLALIEAQGAMARKLTDQTTEREKAQIGLNAAQAEMARLEERLIQLRGTSGAQTVMAQIETQRQAIIAATASVFKYDTAIKDTLALGVDGFAGTLWDEREAAAQSAAEKVQEMITGLRQQLLIDGQINDLQKEIVSNLLSAGLAANDNSISAQQIRDLTKEIYDLDVARTQEAKNLEQTKNFATTIEDLQIEIDQLGRLRESLRLGDEAHAAMAETIAIENMIRRASVEGVNLESEAFQAQIDRIRELVRERNFLSGSYEIASSGSPGGLSDTDRTRRRERFEGLETDLIANTDNPITRLQQQYDQQIKIIEQYEALGVEEKRRANDLKLELDRQYHEAQTRLTLAAGEQAFGALANSMRDMLGEQSGAYKAMFAIQQAFVIATASLNIAKAMSEAIALPFPANLAAWGIVAANAAQIMTAINSVALGFADGGYTGAGGKYDVAGVVHKGEVVWSQQDVARYGGWQNVDAMRRGMMPANDNGGGRSTVDVNVTVTVDDDGRIAAYVRNAQGEAVQAAVTIAGRQTKAMMGQARQEAEQPRISARG